MKRSCDEMDCTENEMITDVSDKDSKAHLPKKFCDNQNEIGNALQIMDVQCDSTNSGYTRGFFNALQSYGHTLVERESNPGGYSLVNPDYVGKKTHQELTELQANFTNAANFTEANAVNKIDMIGQQMKYLQESLYKVIENTKRDSELHLAACNFVKKPGHTYHLYQRPSGQKYFSMLSPKEWNGNCPHKFLGSWFLESDQSWISAEDMHSRHQGLSFLKEFYVGRKSIQ